MSNEDERENERDSLAASPASGGGDNGVGDDEDGESGGAGKKILIFIVPLFLIALAAGLYFTGALDSVLGKAECVEVLDEQGEVIEACPVEEAKPANTGAQSASSSSATGAVFLEIPTMIVNLRSEDSVPRYLRLTVQLELTNANDLSAVEAVIPRVVDQFQTYLRELRVKDLRGSAGIYRLQMELLWRVNQAAAPTQVKDVLFQEILIQ